jgi:hypothetical protein
LNEVLMDVLLVLVLHLPQPVLMKLQVVVAVAG